MLAANGRNWKWFGLGLLAAHVVSALCVFPNYMAYANEAWGGAKNAHWGGSGLDGIDTLAAVALARC